MIKESKCCPKVIKTKLNNPFAMTKTDREDFDNSAKCWISKKTYEEGEVKVNDHDHVTGKNGGSAH